MTYQSQYRVVYGEEAGLDALTEGFNRGFQDYKYRAHFTSIQMQRFLERSGMTLDDCAVLLAREGSSWQGAGVALLAIAGQEAWCGGLAVAPTHRRRGKGRRLMAAIQARARQRGAAVLQLEVLMWNEAARHLYDTLGYTERRELLIWGRPAHQGTLPVPFERLQPAEPRRILEEMHGWHDLTPCWQRRASFLRRSLELMDGYTIQAKDDLPVAYVLCRTSYQGDAQKQHLQIMDVAVDPAADVLQAARPLLQALQIKFMEADLMLVNEPVDSKLNRVFAALGFYVTDRQYELCLDLAKNGGAEARAD